MFDSSIHTTIPAGTYMSVSIPVMAIRAPRIRQVPKGRWRKLRGSSALVYLVNGRRVGAVVRPGLAIMHAWNMHVIHSKSGRRRCDSKRWVEEQFSLHWYRHAFARARAIAMGFESATEWEVG